MTAIDLLCEHWAATRAARKSHTLKLKGGDLTVWWSPWTLDERDYVIEGYDPVLEQRMFRPERFKRAFFRKAEKEDGSRLFSASDLLLIGSRVDPNMVVEVASLMLADLNVANAVGGEAAEDGGPKA